MPFQKAAPSPQDARDAWCSAAAFAAAAASEEEDEAPFPLPFPLAAADAAAAPTSPLRRWNRSRDERAARKRLAVEEEDEEGEGVDDDDDDQGAASESDVAAAICEKGCSPSSPLLFHQPAPPPLRRRGCGAAAHGRRSAGGLAAGRRAGAIRRKCIGLRFPTDDGDDGGNDKLDGEIAEGRCLLRDAALRLLLAPGGRACRQGTSCTASGPGRGTARALEAIQEWGAEEIDEDQAKKKGRRRHKKIVKLLRREKASDFDVRPAGES